MSANVEAYLSREALAELRRVSAWRSLGAIAFTWACIAACFALYAAFPTLLTLIVTWFVMSGRHLALAILMHEGAHGLLLRNKLWNDRVSQWLTAYPTMSDTFVYRRVHFEHHRNTWTDKDPDLGLASALPVTRASFRRKMVRDLSGQTAYQRLRASARYAAGLDPRAKGLQGKSLWQAVSAFATTLRGFLIAQTILLTTLTLLDVPEAYLLVWWLPGVTGYQVVLRLRSIAEHACVADPQDPLRRTRTTLAPAWLRFFVAPHHVNYHLEHHLFMTVPHYNLPRAHGLLREAGVLEHAEVAPGYLSILRAATSLSGPAAVRG